MASKKHVDPLKAKQKRQKVIAAVLGVLFVGVLAFQVPRVMKMMKTPPNPHANDSVTTTTATGTPSLAAPTLRGAEQPADHRPDHRRSCRSLGDADRAGRSARLVQPFREQGSLQPAAERRQGLFAVVVELGRRRHGSSGGSGGTSSPPQSPTGSKPQPGSAVISVNGTLYTVATASDFPQANPLFHLVSVTAHSAKISIAGGSYSSGAATVTLKENKPVTLVNTADGTRYTLILKPLGTGVPGGTTNSSGGSGSSSSAAAVAAAARRQQPRRRQRSRFRPPSPGLTLRSRDRTWR